jgi:hypothetical protein
LSWIQRTLLGLFGVAVIAVVVVQAVLSSHPGVAYLEIATGGLISIGGVLRRRQQNRASTPKV